MAADVYISIELPGPPSSAGRGSKELWGAVGRREQPSPRPGLSAPQREHLCGGLVVLRRQESKGKGTAACGRPQALGGWGDGWRSGLWEQNPPKGCPPDLKTQKTRRLTGSSEAVAPKLSFPPRPGETSGSQALAVPGPEACATQSSQPRGEGRGLWPALWGHSSSKKHQGSFLLPLPKGWGRRKRGSPGPRRA